MKGIQWVFASMMFVSALLFGVTAGMNAVFAAPQKSLHEVSLASVFERDIYGIGEKRLNYSCARCISDTGDIEGCRAAGYC